MGILLSTVKGTSTNFYQGKHSYSLLEFKVFRFNTQSHKKPKLNSALVFLSVSFSLYLSLIENKKQIDFKKLKKK